jgi:anti-anti-sigma factor
MSIDRFPSSQTVVTVQDAHIVISVSGEQDGANAPQLLATLAAAVNTTDSDVIIDLSAVDFMSAATTGVIVSMRETLRTEERTLVVRAPSPCVRHVLELCDLSSIIGDSPRRKPDDSALSTWVEVPARPPLAIRHHMPIEISDESATSEVEARNSVRDGT